MKLLRGTIFGGIAFFFMGFLVWGLLLSGITDTLYDSTLNRPDNGMIWWALVLSNLFYALLLTLVLKWASAQNWIDGVKIGVIFGGLYALTVDLGMYSMTTMINDLKGIVVDLLAYLMVSAVSGLVIVLTWGKKD